MKKFACIFFSVVIFVTTSFSLIVSCSASAVVDFAIDTVLNYAKSLFSSHNDSSAKRIEAARSFYFYKIVNDDYASGKPIYDSTGHNFSDEILTFYFDQYWNTLGDGIVDFPDMYDSNGDIFLQAAGFTNTPWSLSSISFHQPVGSIDNTRYENTFPTFKNYYNTYLARYLLSQGVTATDPNPGKTGLEIAPGYVSGADLKEAALIDNTLFYPKNATNKMTYRTDLYWNNSSGAHKSSYDYMPTVYVKNFLANSSDKELYYILFYFDGEKYYYSNYQIHLYFIFEDVYFDDRDEVEYTKKFLNVEIWDMIDSSIEDSSKFKISDDISDLEYFKIYHYNGFRFFETLLRFYSSISSSNSTGERVITSYFQPPEKSNDLYDVSLSTSLKYNDLIKHFRGTPSSHSCTNNDDIGYIASSSPISLSYNFDTTKIPDDSVITVGGDNIYNYYITNPDTGESSTMNEYITNNYTYITNNNGGEGSGSSGAVGGNVTVGGEISVGGEVGVDINVSVPDININVNNNGAGGTGTGASPNPDDFLGDSEVDLTSYYDKAVEDASGVRQFLGSFFDFLPAELLGLLCLLVAVAICCRIFGR